MNSTPILHRIEQNLQQIFTADSPQPMVGDVWLLASALQKAIRRGETEQALSAALALLQADKKRFWYRFYIIALEDIGVGQPDTVLEVLSAIHDYTWRRKVGEERVALYLVQQCCMAAKSRLMDAVYIQAERDPAHAALRQRLSKESVYALRHFLIFETQATLVERTIAMWYLAGTKKYPSELIPSRVGSIQDAIEAVRRVADTPLTEACIATVGRSQYPLSLFMPLIAYEAKRHRTRVEEYPVPSSGMCGSIPLYAADQFTRVGKASYRMLHKSVAALKPFTPQQIGLAMFYLEGGLVDKELRAPKLDAIQKAGEMTDIRTSGLSDTAYAELREIVQEHVATLEDMRRTQLRAYLKGAA